MGNWGQANIWQTSLIWVQSLLAAEATWLESRNALGLQTCSFKGQCKLSTLFLDPRITHCLVSVYLSHHFSQAPVQPHSFCWFRWKEGEEESSVILTYKCWISIWDTMDPVGPHSSELMGLSNIPLVLPSGNDPAGRSRFAAIRCL